MVVFDVVVNNADRKGGHVLPMAGGHRYGVDHGVSFHTDPKLRTVLWGWAGEPMTEDEVGRSRGRRRRPRRRPRRALVRTCTPYEVEATRRRVARLLRTRSTADAARRLAGDPLAALLTPP